MTVAIVGSANLDLVYRVERIPGPGETVLAASTARHPGGKGNNQAIAAARSGAETVFVTALGRDDAGDLLLRTLTKTGVRALARRVDAETGTALITVDDSAENTIVVAPGAGATLLDLDTAERTAIETAGILLVQLETPVETVADAAETARAAGTTVLLNAAPIRTLPTRLLNAIDLLIVNEHEAERLTREADGRADRNGTDPVDPEELARTLLTRVPAVVITLGAAGALIATAAGSEHITAPRVAAVDTTGAGDTFCGALAAALDRHRLEQDAPAGAALTLPALIEAARFASAAAALCVQRHGAVPSIPFFHEVRSFLALR